MRDVIWTENARRDYFEILAYIAEDNPVAAEKVVDGIERAGNEIGSMPTGRPGRVTGTYEKSVTGLPYIVAYAIHSKAGLEVVTILRVIHTSRDWQSEEWPESSKN